MATNYRSPFRDQFANLFEAILVGDDTDVRFLLENGADVNGRDYNHITPLMLRILVRQAQHGDHLS